MYIILKGKRLLHVHVLNNRIIPTNYYRYKLEKAISTFCTFSKNEKENIDCLFFECPLVNDLKCSVEKWILSMFQIHISFNIPGTICFVWKI